MELCNINQIRPLLARHGFHFSKSMGQNFLIDPEIPVRIAAASEADAGNAVLEIGPGIGALTVQLAKRAGAVVSVELDSALLPVLEETLAGLERVTVVPGDIMKLELPRLAAEQFQGLTPIVCANLPYNITTPVLTRLLESGLFSSVTVLVQREVAQRICAAPGSKDYGAFTLLCQYYADCSLLFEVPPECFLPAPKVTSAVVRMVCRPAPAEIKDPALFFRVVRGSFLQRRKKLLNGLASAFPALTKEQLRRCLAQAGLAETVRGEQLSLEQFAALSGEIGSPLTAGDK